MHLSNLKPKHPRKDPKRIGRGGKRGTTSGSGTKGQKGRAGASVRPGFRGGDNRIWQLFPKVRGASSKPGNKSPHRKHRFYRVHHARLAEVNLRLLEAFKAGDTVNPETLAAKGIVPAGTKIAKVLGTGDIKRALSFSGLKFSASAKEKIEKAGGTITQ
jgi:large subunit ribosomal protein L15